MIKSCPGKDTIYLVETFGSGGICQFTHDLCEHLARAGREVVLVTTYGYELSDISKSFKVVKLLLPFPRDNRARKGFFERLSRLARHLWNFLALTLYLGSRRCGVIHYQRFLERFFVTHLRLLKTFGKRLIYTAHDVLPHDGKPEHAERLRHIYRAADRVIVLTEYTKMQFEEHFPESKGKVSVIAHGNFDYLVGKDSGEQATETSGVLLFFGHIRDYKGLEILLKAFNIAVRERPELSLHIVGDIAEKGRTLEYYMDILEAHARDKVRFIVNYVNIEDIPAYFGPACMVVLPYLTASQSGVVQMAYSFGKPVIAAKVGGLPEQVEEGLSGVLVSPGDENELADAICRLTGDPGKLGEMGRYARQLSRTRFSWRNIAALTLDEYYSLYD